MQLEKAYIPYGQYWSTPFARWQGSFGSLHSMELAAQTARRVLEKKETPLTSFDQLVLGITVMQRRGFYGAPWLAGMIGAPTITGPTVSQACATSARALATAALEVETGQSECTLTVTCDRTSNGPHIYYPSPKGIGGMGEAENPVWDNFNADPYTGKAMIETAENVARQAGISREAQDALTGLRYQQYTESLAKDRAFQRRYMVPVEIRLGRKKTIVVEADEGIHPTTEEGLAKLRPVTPDGTVTFGTQTHPADGNAGMVVSSRDRACALSRDPHITIQICSFGSARVEKAMMPKAVVPAAQQALQRADIPIHECAAIKTHNPFSVNDIYFSREMGVDVARMNQYGSPLIWGHPQAPTGHRAIIEMIEQLVINGGGYGLFSGCAAGDTAMAVVIKVT